MTLIELAIEAQRLASIHGNDCPLMNEIGEPIQGLEYYPARHAVLVLNGDSDDDYETVEDIDA